MVSAHQDYQDGEHSRELNGEQRVLGIGQFVDLGTVLVDDVLGFCDGVGDVADVFIGGVEGLDDEFGECLYLLMVGGLFRLKGLDSVVDVIEAFLGGSLEGVEGGGEEYDGERD